MLSEPKPLASSFEAKAEDRQVLPAAEPSSRPDKLSEEDAAEIKARAAGIVAEVEQATGSKSLELMDSIASLGMQTQRKGGDQLEFLRSRVGDMLNDKGVAGQVTKDLVELRVTLEKINPAASSNGASGLKRVIPFSSSAIRRLERVAIRYEPVSKQITLIERRLAEGRALLRADNVELRQLYEEIEAQELPIARNVYLGEQLMAGLEALLERTTEATLAERLQTLLFDVATRVQDLRTMEEVHSQFFIGIEMTRVNNNRLGQAVDRTLSLTTRTLTVGLALQAALSRQRRVLEATQRTREFLGDLIVANAASIKEQASEIGDVYRDPIVAIEKIEQAHRDLVDAVTIAGRLEAEGIELAKANVVKLKDLTVELSKKATDLAQRSANESIEA